MAEHLFEASCQCGMTWRLYLTDVDDDDDPVSTCPNCGNDSYDLTNVGEARSAGPGTT